MSAYIFCQLSTKAVISFSKRCTILIEHFRLLLSWSLDWVTIIFYGRWYSLHALTNFFFNYNEERLFHLERKPVFSVLKTSLKGSSKSYWSWIFIHTWPLWEPNNLVLLIIIHFGLGWFLKERYFHINNFN